MQRERPRPPFDAWPGHRVVNGVGHAWFGEPAVLVNQSVIEHADVEAALRLQDLIDEVRAATIDECTPAGGLAVIHDWRSLRSHDPAARPAFLARMRSRPKGYLRMAIVIVDGENRFLRMAIEMGNLLAATVTGGRVEVVPTPHAALARLGARPRAAGARFPVMG